MTATNHVITGALIGAVVHQPGLAIPAAFLSHFVCDALPHFGNGKKLPMGLQSFTGYLIVDCLAAGLVLLSLLTAQPANWSLMFICGVAAASPDLMWLPGYVRMLHKKPRFITRNWLLRFHSYIQWSQTPAGAIPELIWLLVFGMALMSHY